MTVRPPELLWALLFLISITGIAAICWAMKTNSLQWSENLYAIAGIAAFATALFSWSLHHWLAIEQSKKDLIAAKEARKVRAEQWIIEDRKEARLEKIRNQERAETLREEQKARRRKGAIRNLYSFLFGDP